MIVYIVSIAIFDELFQVLQVFSSADSANKYIETCKTNDIEMDIGFRSYNMQWYEVKK